MFLAAICSFEFEDVTLLVREKNTHTQAHSLQIFYLITGFAFFCAHFLATSRMSCFVIILSAGVFSAEIPWCVILQLKYIYIYLSETLKHFLFPPLHEWAIEQTVLLKLNSHSFIYMVSDCPFLAKKTQFLSFYSYFNSVVSALSCVKKKMILLWMALTETPATKPHLRAKFPFYSQRWSGSKHQESRAEERNLNSWCILPVNK